MQLGGAPLEKGVIAAGVLTGYDFDGTTPVGTVNVVGSPTITSADRV